jgi:site-specific DNA-methyltransferase (adenine-specific)
MPSPTKPRLIQADCLSGLGQLDVDSADAIVTDPPAGIEFMGEEWDQFKRGRVARYRHRHIEQKPPPSMMQSRLSHPEYGSRVNLQCRRCGRYQFGNDRPHPECAKRGHDWALDYSTRDTFQAFLTAVFTECRRVLKPGGYAFVWAIPRLSHWTATAVENAGLEIRDIVHHHYGTGMPKGRDVAKTMAGPEATRWRDWSTTLKPATEHWILARLPLAELTVGRNLTRFGVGALNIGATRTPRADAPEGVVGRWPSNLVLSHAPACVTSSGNTICVPSCPVALLDRQCEGAGKTRPAGRRVSTFFYICKASTAERNLGLNEGQNLHPTVKPLALMQRLCRLITPPGGVILDPFMGSGTTGIAAMRENFGFVGIERDPAYYRLASTRIRSLTVTQARAERQVKEAA